MLFWNMTLLPKLINNRMVTNMLFDRTRTAVRCITTSKKQQETVTAPVTSQDTAEEPVRIIKRRDWITYGYDATDERRDLLHMHVFSFFFFSVLLVGGGFILMYYPDMMDHEWIFREAYLEIRRREDLGLPLVDPNYTDPANVPLPSEEELGDYEIVL